jgi:hypothetical protein
VDRAATETRDVRNGCALSSTRPGSRAISSWSNDLKRRQETGNGHEISKLCGWIHCDSDIGGDDDCGKRSAAAASKPSFNDAVAFGAEPVAVRRTVAARGPRGGVAVRTTAHRPGVRPVHPIARPGVRPGVRPVHPIARPGRWVRPPYYTWRPGGAIAAGAALGFVAASAAVAYGTPPVAGYCWYYTDLSRTQGFWDVCPY